jgi:hypothetical protein
MTKIHLQDAKGMYNLIKYNSDSAQICTKYSNPFWVILTDIKYIAGGNWNKNIPKWIINKLVKAIEKKACKKYKYDLHFKKIY